MPSALKTGMTIYVASGTYTEDVVIRITSAVGGLNAVSIIGMGDDGISSKRVLINGNWAIVGLDIGMSNTIYTAVLNNLEFAQNNPARDGIAISGYGIGVTLKNGLYTTTGTPTADLITITSTGTTSTNRTRLSIDDCSVTNDAATATNLVYATNGAEVFSINHSDLTHLGTGKCLNIDTAIISFSFASGYTTGGTTAVSVLVTNPSLASPRSSQFTQCGFQSRPVTTSGMFLFSTSATTTGVCYQSFLNCSFLSTNTSEATPNAYIYQSGGKNLGTVPAPIPSNIVVISRSNVQSFSTSATLTPFQSPALQVPYNYLQYYSLSFQSQGALTSAGVTLPAASAQLPNK
jgi:hypothetical protein